MSTRELGWVCGVMFLLVLDGEAVVFRSLATMTELLFSWWIYSYVSSDFGNHPLSHLMGSVFGMHDRENVEVSFLSSSLFLSVGEKDKFISFVEA